MVCYSEVGPEVSLLTMRWLFAVFVASLCALLWAAISMARHIRRASRKVPATQQDETQPVLQRDIR